MGIMLTQRYYDFIGGCLVNPYDKTINGVGYLGKGIYKYFANSRQYSTWSNMIKRCYSEKQHEVRPTYIGCTVCEEWHNFQNFAKWYDKNIYSLTNEIMNLDKDILIKGNKIYSPENCVFAPIRINSLFIQSKSKRGIYPIGVSFHKRDKKFRSQCHDESDSQHFLGSFPTPEEAFSAYKTYKENLIKQIAEEYKPLIPNNLYTAMINYQVEITD
jgi:hypothetical protein